MLIHFAIITCLIFFPEKYAEEYVYWVQDAQTFHQTVASASITDIMLNKSDFMVITGGPGTGKTALARYISLTLYRQGWSIVPINSTEDLFEFLTQIHSARQKYVLFIDDFLGRQAICKAKARQWVQLYRDIVGPLRVIATCRLQISNSPEFTSLRNMFQFTVCNISEDFKNSISEMHEIALCYMDTQTAEVLFEKNIHENDNFYTLCFLNSKLNDSIDLNFFVNASHTIEEKLSDMFEHNKLCFLQLALNFFFDGKLRIQRFEDNDERLREFLNFVREELNLSSIENSQILEDPYPLNERYLKDNIYKLSIIHPELVDILSLYFFKKIPKSMLKYGSDYFLQMKLQLETPDNSVIPGTIMIEKCHEDMFFDRLINDIEKKKFVNAFDNIQVANNLYQEKLIAHLSKSSEPLELVLSDFELLLRSVVNGASGLVKFIIAECKNRHYLIEGDKNEFYIHFDERALLNLYPHIEEESLLLVACLKGHIDVAKVLINLGFDKDYQDNFERTPLQMACLHGHIDVVKFLLLCNCDVNLCNSDGETALHHACFWGYTDIVDIFLQTFRNDTADCFKPDYNMRNTNMKTPLFLACEKGHLDIVECFATLESTSPIPVTNPFDINITDQYERTMLHVACKNEYSGIVAILLEKNFVVNEYDTKGRTALFYACKKGYTEIVSLLMTKDICVDVQDNLGQTPLHIACDRHHDNIVLILLECKCRLNIEDKNGKIPLHLAVQNNSADIIDMLMQSQNKYFSLDRQNESTTLCKQNTNSTVYACDINAQDKKGQTALHIACSEGYVDCVKTLLNYKCDINICDKEDKTALIYACESQDENVVDLLIDNKADVNKSDKNGLSPLHIVVQKENMKILKTIMECNQCQVNSMCEDVRSALHIAIDKRNAPIVEMLLNSNCDVNQRGLKLQTPLMYACASSNVSDIKKLLLNANCDVNIPDEDGQSPLHIACKDSNIQLIKMILTKCQDINAIDNFGRNALHYASEYSYTNTIDLLLRAHCNINKRDSNNETPIFYAFRNYNTKSNIQTLIKNHCDLNVTNKNGMTLLHIACHKDELALVRTLIRNGCDVNITDKLGRTALHIACEYSNEDSIELLIDVCDVNLKNKKGQTSLHIACHRLNSEIVNLIVQHASDLNIQDKSGTTALHIAVKGREISIIDTILMAKSDVNIRDEMGQTPLFYAVEDCQINIVKLLLNHNCDVTVINNDGNNVMQIASRKGYTDIVNMLSL